MKLRMARLGGPRLHRLPEHASSPRGLCLYTPPGARISAPVRSLWQIDTIGLQLAFGITWGLRDPCALAWLTTKW